MWSLHVIFFAVQKHNCSYFNITHLYDVVFTSDFTVQKHILDLTVVRGAKDFPWTFARRQYVKHVFGEKLIPDYTTAHDTTASQLQMSTSGDTTAGQLQMSTSGGTVSLSPYIIFCIMFVCLCYNPLHAQVLDSICVY
jgi:hypothetical protein